jgi:hypothetical protein
VPISASLPVFLNQLSFKMPTRQEVLEGLRVLSEEILECLRFLFVMLFSMTKAV